ncbi:MAG: class I fructose-bisphosphate aldolase [Myxococcota bacterium]
MSNTAKILGKDAHLLSHTCRTIAKEQLQLPGPDFIDRVFIHNNRTPCVLRNLSALFNHGRLKGTGYVSILPVDQGIEHSAGASFGPNPHYFDPANIVQLALEGGCSAVATTYGALASVARRYAHKIPLILKCNHNELLSYPPLADQTVFAQVQQAFEMGCVGVGATVYWGSHQSRQQLQEVSELFAQAHELGLFTILWCYVRNSAFKHGGTDYQCAADLTGQANHLGATLGADIVKQKLPTCNGGYKTIGFGHTCDAVYDTLCSDHPIDLARYQVVNSYMGRCGLISSGGPSGQDDGRQAVIAAVINKRAGGMGLICGRKAFQKPRKEGIQLLHAVQDVYADSAITIA